MAEHSLTGIEVTASCSFIRWEFRWRPVVVQIDLGALHKMAWGAQFFPQEPGRHHVKVYIEGAIFGAENAANAMDVMVEEGKVTRVTYEAPVWIWQLKGPMKAEAPVVAFPTQSAPSPTPFQPPAASAPAHAPDASGITCAQCGARSLQGARFCHACGAPMPQPRACPACGHVQASGQFCSHCGTKMGD